MIPKVSLFLKKEF